MKDAEVELKRLENRETYLLNKIENLKSLVLPKGISIEPEKIPSTKRVDKNLEYVIQLEEVEKELKYIRKEMKNLMNYIEKELKRLDKYSPLEKRIYDLRHDREYLRVHNKPMPFWKIGQSVGYSQAQCFRIYQKMKQNETKV